MATSSGFETAAAILVQTIVQHNPELQKKLNNKHLSVVSDVLKPWYRAMFVMTSTAQDPKEGV